MTRDVRHTVTSHDVVSVVSPTSQCDTEHVMVASRRRHDVIRRCCRHVMTRDVVVMVTASLGASRQPCSSPSQLVRLQSWRFTARETAVVETDTSSTVNGRDERLDMTRSRDPSINVTDVVQTHRSVLNILDSLLVSQIPAKGVVAIVCRIEIRKMAEC